MSDPTEGATPLVEWEATGRRVLRTAVAASVAALAIWVAWSLVGGDWAPVRLRNLFGLVLLVVFLVEVWVVGGAALRGMLRAGDRGERLAGRDVGLLPPQLRPGGSITPGLLRDQADSAGSPRIDDEPTA